MLRHADDCGRSASGLLALGILVAALLTACDPPPVTGGAACAPGAELVARVYGSLDGELDWRGDALQCEGMPRPRGQGARLRFEGPSVAGSAAERLAFIIALPGLERGRTAMELPAGVTLMEVNAARFFSSPDQAGCWADVERQEPLGPAAAGEASDEYGISGLLFCVSPLAEMNGTASVTLRDLRFTGRVNWGEPR